MKLKLSLSGQVAGQPIKAQRSETAQRQFNLRSGLFRDAAINLSLKLRQKAHLPPRYWFDGKDELAHF